MLKMKGLASVNHSVNQKEKPAENIAFQRVSCPFLRSGRVEPFFVSFCFIFSNFAYRILRWFSTIKCKTKNNQFSLIITNEIRQPSRQPRLLLSFVKIIGL